MSRKPILESFENGEDCLKLIKMIKIEEIYEDQSKIKNEIKQKKHIIKEGIINFENKKKTAQEFMCFKKWV